MNIKQGNIDALKKSILDSQNVDFETCTSLLSKGYSL
ncbi:MPPV-037 ankyrin repeat protein [Magpiepox virus 2]|nr:MPPV-037 ankyrin repeat protein [Magpiepox virus 2]